MRVYLLGVGAGLLVNCYGNPPPPEAVPLTPHFVVGSSARRLIVDLPEPAFVTVVAFSELGHYTLLAPVTPIGRLSFGPQPAGRSEVRLLQAVRYAVGPGSAYEPQTHMPVWSLADWPILVVVASEEPLNLAVIRKAYPVTDPRAQYARSTADRRAVRLATSIRFLTLLEQAQPLLARALIEH